MSRFWRFDNSVVKEGTYFYLDPAEITMVDYAVNDEGSFVYQVCLRDGMLYEIADADGQKLMRWAEENAESIPEVALEQRWR